MASRTSVTSENITHQKFERKVIDDLRLLFVAALPGARPAVVHAIADDAGQAHEMVESRGRARVLALVVLNLLDEALADRLGVEGELVDRDARPGRI